MGKIKLMIHMEEWNPMYFSMSLQHATWTTMNT